MTHVCTVLGIRCEAKGADPYGQVLQGGYIVLQGKLISGIVKNNLWGYSVVDWDAQGGEYSASLDFDTEEDKEDPGQGTESKVCCFELFRETEWGDRTNEEAGDHRIHSILLREGDEPGTFKRTGTVFGIPALAFDTVPDVTVKII
jgi:hypothetical protein